MSSSVTSNSVSPNSVPSLNLECEICRENYDSDHHKPMIFIPCGHGACSSCTTELQKADRTRKCHTCRTNWQINPIRNWDFAKRLEEASQTMVASAANHIREAEEKKSEEAPNLGEEEAPEIQEMNLNPVPEAPPIVEASPLNQMRNRLAIYILTYLPLSRMISINFPGYNFTTRYGDIEEEGQGGMPRPATEEERMNVLSLLREGLGLGGVISIEGYEISINLDLMTVRNTDPVWFRDQQESLEFLTQIFPNWNDPIPENVENIPNPAIQGLPVIEEEMIIEPVAENEPILEEIDDERIEIEHAIEMNPESRLSRIAAASRNLLNSSVEGVRNLGSTFVRSPARGLFNLVARPLSAIASAFSSFERQRIQAFEENVIN